MSTNNLECFKLLHLLFSSQDAVIQGVYSSGNSEKKRLGENSGNSRPTQGTFMNKVNNFFTWRNIYMYRTKKIIICKLLF